jgi:DNA-binding transcriptional regulator YiaG
VILRDNADEVAARRVTAAWVRSVRTQLGLTQARFAEALGVHTSSVTGWENASWQPVPELRVAIQVLASVGADSPKTNPEAVRPLSRGLAGNSPRRAEGMG